MIESIHLQNYQSHEETSVEFVPGMNVIVGTSDSGKSSIFRALGTVMLNRPMGDGLVSHWAKEDGKIRTPLTVTARIDGRRLLRERGKDNVYVLDDEEYRAFGTDVPDPIVSFLNLSDESVQSQHDGVFLLSESPGAVARKLNAVVNLDKMDEAIKRAESRKRKVKHDAESLDTDVQALQKSVDGLEWLDEADSGITAIEAREAQLATLRRESEAVGKLVRQFETIDLDQFSWIPNAESELEQLVTRAESLKPKLEESSGIVQCVSDVLKIEAKLEGMSEVDDAAFDTIEELRRRIESHRTRDREHGLIAARVSELKSVRRALLRVEDEIGPMEAEWHEAMEGACPLCGRTE